ncbi:hypothetical protein GCM10020358_39600 [Amorphoplanes nipponensis]|uniref:Uncharacterized protein n=1 Tax=Actinoplanes nipponensis TaxID=135950 RepID=A0A919JKB3_9ACTN|nr:hypothetical protein [Actinoplanes nipponensis]GIE51002.1 hypothetical protein Ani05nite_45360 [Actinoplanes nipponensis]
MKVAVGILLLAIGATLLTGGLMEPEDRITVIVLAVLALVAGYAALAERIVLFALAVWGVGWACLIGGITTGEWVAAAGGAIAVLAGGVAFATNNWVTWLSVASLANALALGALAWWSGATVTAAGAAAGAAASAIFGVATLRGTVRKAE